MPDYDNTNRGAMYKNDKEGVEKRPDYRGSLNVDGVAYWISGWIREAGPNSKMTGQKFMSLQVEPKEAQQRPVAKPSKATALPDDSDIPF